MHDAIRLCEYECDSSQPQRRIYHSRCCERERKRAPREIEREGRDKVDVGLRRMIRKKRDAEELTARRYNERRRKKGYKKTDSINISTQMHTHTRAHTRIHAHVSEETDREIGREREGGRERKCVWVEGCVAVKRGENGSWLLTT